MSSVLNISPEALAMIRQLRDQEQGEGESALLVEITGLRGDQFGYELAFVPLADARPDQTVERHGDLAVVMPTKDIPNLTAADLTLTDDGLAMNNPNGPSPTMAAPKGDLTGPLADRVAQVLAESVNPAIAVHGGAASLVSIDGSVAYLQLSGGCQGCGMASVTLKQGIEKILLDSITELTEVVDVTDHMAGADPYYQKSKK
jgi:Fe/S biogenesis protein NfuA